MAGIGYIEVADGNLPTRPAPILRFYSRPLADVYPQQLEYVVEVVDQHGDPHEFICGLETRRVAREITDLLADHILAALPGEIISLATFADGDSHD